MPGSILFVEDDDAFRTTVARYLRRHGFGVIEADSAEDARSRLEAGLQPALVLLDINLPGDSGWSLLRSGPLAAGDPVRPPVVVVSAVSINPKRLRESHVAGYLPKPFPLETLVDTVERLVQEGSPREP